MNHRNTDAEASPETMLKGSTRIEREPRAWEMTQRELDQQTWLDDHLTNYYSHEHGLWPSLRRMFGGSRNAGA